MNQLEFGEQVKRLKEVFGDRAYPDERCKILWKNFQHISGIVFRQVCDEFIANSRQAPLLGDFFDPIARLSAVKKSTEPVSVVYCDHCNGHGFVLLENDVGGRAAGSCSMCDAGKALRAKERGATPSELKVRSEGYTRLKKLNAETFTTSDKMPEPLRAVCAMIKEGRTDNGAFKFGCAYLGLSEDQVWQVYQAFISGNAHSPDITELIRRVKNRTMNRVGATLASKALPPSEPQPEDEEDVA